MDPAAAGINPHAMLCLCAVPRDLPVRRAARPACAPCRATCLCAVPRNG